MHDFFSSLGLPKLQWKIFVSSFGAMFIIVTLQYLGVRPPQFLQTPLPYTEDIFYKEVQPKLEEKEIGSFSLHRSKPIIPQAHAAGAYDAAKAYAVLDFTTGEVILEKNSKEQVAIASLTKIMTAIIALDLAGTDTVLSVSPRAANIIPTKIGVITGEEMTVKELLEAVLLTSANDAAQVIKEGIDDHYNSEVFIKAMNKKAELLGLKNTHFDNPQGFDGKNYSSAEDLALLTHYAMKNYPVFSEIVKKEHTFLPADTNHKQFDLPNWNGLIGVYPRISGVKIGNTTHAGKTTVVLSERRDKPMLAVLLGAPGITERDLWTAALLDVAYEEKFDFKPINITEKQLLEKYETWRY